MDSLDVGQQQQPIAAQAPREQGRAEILVDHGLGAAESTRAIADDGDAAAAGADDDHVGLDESLDRGELQHAAGLGRGHHTSQSPTIGGVGPYGVASARARVRKARTICSPPV